VNRYLCEYIARERPETIERWVDAEAYRSVTTAAEAAASPSFWGTTSSGAEMYETTTMEDCCRPSCASIDWISGRGLTTDPEYPEYNAFYSCDANGVPITE
jgi:hypothetical protein